MEGHLKMCAKERERLKIFERVKRGELQQKEAAVLCQLEYCYLRRLYKRYCEQGDRGLVHQGRGQSGKILTLVLRWQLRSWPCIFLYR